MRRPVCLALLATLATGAASAGEAPITVIESYMVGRIVAGEETLSEERGNRFPNRPQESCYAWVIRIEQQNRLASITEVLTLPDVALNWGEADKDEFSTIQVSPDYKRASNTTFQNLATGELSSEWCVADGDPNGKHRFTISEGDRLLAEFDFEVYRP